MEYKRYNKYKIMRKEVWQYGSNESLDPLNKQDGVAPQTKCGGINDNQRVYIPNVDGNGNHIPKGFISSHLIKNYTWIFNIKPNLPNNLSNGYVKPR